MTPEKLEPGILVFLSPSLYHCTTEPRKISEKMQNIVFIVQTLRKNGIPSAIF